MNNIMAVVIITTFALLIVFGLLLGEFVVEKYLKWKENKNG